MKKHARTGLSRRQFVASAGALAGLAVWPQTASPCSAGSGVALVQGGRPSTSYKKMKEIKIEKVSSTFEREPLIRPFGFKGGYLTEIWQAVAMMESGSGMREVGLGTQSVLWSDASVFAAHSEAGGNALMYALTERALQMVKGQTFTSPVDLLDSLWRDVLDYGKKVTGNPDLRETFALNALVPFDNAAWLLYAHENGLETFDDMIPEAYRPGLAYRHERVASIPTIGTTIPVVEMEELVDDGYFFLKLKFGSPGTQEEMLEKDMERLTLIHQTIGDRETSATENGKIPYYIDFNGRYEAKDTVMRLLDHAKEIGAFSQIAVLEEPFPEEMTVDVSDVPVPVVADESAHTEADVIERIEMGYGGVALKAAAKTLSMTMKMAQVAHERGVPCFVADLTVNPILVDWNKNVAARLAPFPGFKVGLLENNGRQNYLHWEEMRKRHPYGHAEWTEAKDGFFETDETFYQTSGGVLATPAYYLDLFEQS